MSIVVRMAPSPTGEYHIGSLRTYLYNYALARKHNGTMVLRIEDTDKSREVEGAVERLMDVISSYGLSWDEGPNVGGPNGPYVQSKRLDIYKKYAEKLVEAGHAYYCFCSTERLTNLRNRQREDGLPTKYDKHCLNLSKDEIKKRLDAGDPYVIRLNVEKGEDISWNDLVVSEVTVNTSEVDDQILLKSDGYPTYHLAVVVDDHLMGMTHVLRGNEWLPSTPKQILLFRYLGWDAPEFGHLPNLKEAGSNKKMSKRHGDVHAIAFLEKGYLPKAVLNFLMFLGWNPGTEKEIYSLQEFINDFSINKIHKTDLVAFDRKKLLWYNGYYIRNMSTKELWEVLLDWSSKFNIALNGVDAPRDKALKILSLVQERMKLLSEYNSLVDYFFSTPKHDTKLLLKQAKSKEAAKDILEEYIALYRGIEVSNWTVENLEKLSHDLLDERDYKIRQAFMSLRVALSGRDFTPPLFDMMGVLGKDVVLDRLKGALLQL